MSSQSGDNTSVESAQTGAPKISITSTDGDSDANSDIDLESHVATPSADGKGSDPCDAMQMSQELNKRLEAYKGKTERLQNEFEPRDDEKTKSTAKSIASNARTGLGANTIPGSPFFTPQGEQTDQPDHHFLEQLGDKAIDADYYRSKRLQAEEHPDRARGKGKGPGA